MKKLVSLIIIIALMCSCAFAEGGMLSLFDAAVDLAYDTHNVTLTAEATFSFDGEEFKVMHASYKQDGENSYLDYILDTPKADGSVYTGGFRVLGVGPTVYANDTYYGDYYYVTAQYASDTVLSADAQSRSMLSLARTLAACAEPLESVFMDVSGNTYTFKAGALPGFINETAFYLVRDYLLDRYYRNLFNEEVIDKNTYIYYEDIEALIAGMYFKLYNEELPTGAYDDAIMSRIAVAYNWSEQIENEIRSSYNGGYVFIRNDGTTEWYEDLSELYLANGIVDISYQYETAAVSAYYEEMYGEPFTEDMYKLAVYSPNNELWMAYYDILLAANEYYSAKAKEINPTAVRATVLADGTIKTSSSIGNGYYMMTKTSEIMMNVKTAELGSLDAVVTTDENGRLTAFNGTTEIKLTYTDGSEHVLFIDFELGAKDYDTTSVNTQYDAEEYGWISYDEYISNVPVCYEDSEAEAAWDNFIKNAPETLTIAGQTYETMMNLYYYD